MFDRCLVDRGEGDRCLICPLAHAKVCSTVTERLHRLLQDSRNRDYKMSEPDRQTLFQETLNAIIRRVDTALQGTWDIDHIGAYTSSIFQKKRAAYYSKAPRFGDWSTVKLASIPQGLQSLVVRHAGMLRLEGKFLAAAAMMARTVQAELLALTADRTWKKNVDLLYANTWKGLLENGDELKGYGSVGTSALDPEEVVLHKQRWQIALSPYVQLWMHIGSEQAKNCAKFFSEFGKELLSNESRERNDLATALKVQENTLNKRVSRCYALIHEHLISLLTNMAGQEPQLCLHLFTRVYGTVGQGMGIQQRLDKAAEDYGLSREAIHSRLRRCRKLIMAQIDW